MMPNLHIAGILIAGVLWLVSKYSRIQAFSDAGFILFCITILSFVITYNQQRLRSYLQMHADVSYLPAKRIRTTNNILLAAFSIILLACMIILPRIHYQDIATTIGTLFRRLIGAFLGLFFPDSYDPSVGDVDLLKIDYGTGTPTAAQSGLLDQILAALQAVFGVLAIVFFVILVFLGARWLMRRLLSHEHTVQADNHEYIDVRETRQDIDIERQPSKRRNKIWGRSPNQRIRHLWQREIARRTLRVTQGKATLSKAQALAHSTPREAERIAELEPNGYHELLHEGYEKARYSQDGCTAQDVSGLTDARRRSARS